MKIYLAGNLGGGTAGSVGAVKRVKLFYGLGTQIKRLISYHDLAVKDLSVYEFEQVVIKRKMKNENIPSDVG